MPTIWEQALAKQLRRRNFWAAQPHLPGPGIAAMAHAVSDVSARPWVLACWAPPGGEAGLLGGDLLAPELVRIPPLPEEFQVLMASRGIEWVEADANLHAEMAIVRRIAVSGFSKDQLGGFLQICRIGGPICVDCCGWLTKHGIAHGPNCGKTGTSAWTNPLTNALFRGEGDDLAYSKPQKYSGTATRQNQHTALK